MTDAIVWNEIKIKVLNNTLTSCQQAVTFFVWDLKFESRRVEDNVNSKYNELC